MGTEVGKVQMFLIGQHIKNFNADFCIFFMKMNFAVALFGAVSLDKKTAGCGPTSDRGGFSLVLINAHWLRLQ